MSRISAFFASLFILTTSSFANDTSITTSFSEVKVALDRGYGGMCGLDHKLTDRNGYYRCIDIGPYRFVAEYGRTRGFVITNDGYPFEIAINDHTGSRFTYQGPWTTDLPTRVSEWSNNEIAGLRKHSEALSAEQKRIQDAKDSVETYLQSANPSQPLLTPEQKTETPSQPAPQVYYIVPPNFTPTNPATAPAQPSYGSEIPVTGIPTPSLVQQGVETPGVLVAPGVVAYPTQ